MSRFFIAFETNNTTSKNQKQNLYSTIKETFTEENVTLEETPSGVVILGIPKHNTEDEDTGININEKVFTNLLTLVRAFSDMKPHFTTAYDS